MYIRIQNPAHELLCSFAAFRCDSEVGSTHGLVPMAVKPFGAAVRRVETIDGAEIGFIADTSDFAGWRTYRPADITLARWESASGSSWATYACADEDGPAVLTAAGAPDSLYCWSALDLAQRHGAQVEIEWEESDGPTLSAFLAQVVADLAEPLWIRQAAALASTGQRQVPNLSADRHDQVAREVAYGQHAGHLPGDVRATVEAAHAAGGNAEDALCAVEAFIRVMRAEFAPWR